MGRTNFAVIATDIHKYFPLLKAGGEQVFAVMATNILALILSVIELKNTKKKKYFLF